MKGAVLIFYNIQVTVALGTSVQAGLTIHVRTR